MNTISMRETVRIANLIPVGYSVSLGRFITASSLTVEGDITSRGKSREAFVGI